jgi:hypothetical protein
MVWVVFAEKASVAAEREPAGPDDERARVQQKLAGFVKDRPTGAKSHALRSVKDVLLGRKNLSCGVRKPWEEEELMMN